MKTKYGHMAHAECGTRCLVRVNDRGTLSLQCDECDTTEYAQKGTGKHTRWEKKIERIGGEQPAPAPKPAPVKGGEQPAPKKKTVWDEI